MIRLFCSSMPINSLLSFIVSGICSVSRLKNHLVTKEVTNKQLFYFAIYNKVVRKHASYCFSQERFFYIKITTIYFTEYQPKRETSVKKNTYSLKIFLWIICQFQKSSYLCIRNRETNTDSRKQKAEMLQQDGPFVYRLGRKIFILERGVRFPHGLQVKRIKN